LRTIHEFPDGIVFLGAGIVIGYLLAVKRVKPPKTAAERPVPVADAHGQAENVANGKRDDGLRLVS
jgi:hypothetical protein